MRKRGSIMSLGIIMILPCLCFLLDGCTLGPDGYPESILGTPDLYVYNGFRLIKKAKPDDAQREFEKALRLKPDYSPAHRGLGLAHGMNGNFEAAFKSMNLAKRYAEEKEQEALAHVGMMRLYTMKRDPGWLDSVEKHFGLATLIVKDLPEAHYYMGSAYNDSYRLADSKEAFKKVQEIDESMTREAERQLELIRKIEKAKPGSELAKRLAFSDRIKRADTAALLIHELRVDRIYEKALLTGYISAEPSGEKEPAKKARTEPLDVAGHPMKAEIDQVLQLNIKGLSPFWDGSFGPDEYVTRAAFAVTMADIVMAIERDPDLPDKYAGVSSPYADVPNDASYFYAVMICKGRGRIMEGKYGFFDPMGTLSGAEALLVIRRLKDEHNISY